MPDSLFQPTDPGVKSPTLRWFLRHIPALDSLRTYTLASFGRDLLAGLTVATIAVPQAMAYAMLAGLPPQYGLYTAIIMTAVGALLDSSKQLINGPTNAISISLLSALVLIPEGDRIAAAITLAFLVGVVQLGIALLKLGDLTRFVSHSIIVGFTMGASVLLILDQTKHLLGLQPRGGASDHFLHRFWLTIVNGSIHWPTVMVSAGTIFVVLLVRNINRYLSHWIRFPLPQHLIAVVAMAFMVWSLNLHDQGSNSVKIVGALPSSLPSFSLPELKSEQIRLMMGSAFSIAILGLLEAIAMAKAIAARTKQRLDVNQQCLSEGAANLAGSFFHCFPGSGSLTRSAVNQQAGAVSQWSGVFAAVAVAGTVLAFAPLAAFIPRASLAGLLILAAYRMIDGKQLLFHMRATKFDCAVVITTALAAVLISIEFCIVIGVFMSFALYVSRAAQVKSSRLVVTSDGALRPKTESDPHDERLLALELEGELFFGAEVELARHFARITEAARGQVKMVILVLRRGRNPDAGFLALLQDLHEVLVERDIALVLSEVQPDMAASLQATGLATIIGEDRIFPASASEQGAGSSTTLYAMKVLANLEATQTPEPLLDSDTKILELAK